MEDNRFKEIRKFKKKELPFNLHWFVDQDYFSNEMVGFQSYEINDLKKLSEQAFKIFEKATDKMIQTNRLDYLNIPDFFHQTIINSWNNRKENPFFLGRFDINGGVDGLEAKVIEFNADTFTTLPETLIWQTIQNKELVGNDSFNILERELLYKLKELRNTFSFEEVNFVASSLGYEEDINNCNTVLNLANQVGYKCFYKNLDQIIFSEEEGIFYDLGNEEYQPIDVWFKIIPWDWMFIHEPELAKSLSVILEKKLAVILNPPYTALWQNKKFMAYITEHFPNSYIAETFTEQNGLSEFVRKPIYGRIGENIFLQAEKNFQTKGDFADQPVIYQKYYPLAVDKENYSYQFGMFYSDKPLAFNIRVQNSKIINDNCDFMSHYIF